MNWYKKATENEDPEWDYPDSQHDYNPYWDYEHDSTVDQKIKLFVNQYVDELKVNLFPHIGFLENVKIAFVKLDEDALAMYINGTQPYVVIAIDVQKIKRIAEEIDEIDQLEYHIKVTIVHEIAHAIQEGIDIDSDENEAESFAKAYVDYNEIENFWEEQE